MDPRHLVGQETPSPVEHPPARTSQLHPILLEFDFHHQHLTLRAYSAAMVLAMVVVIVGSGVAAVRRGLPFRQVSVCLLAATAVAPIGARLLNWASHSGAAGPESDWATAPGFSGFSLDGGLLLAICVGLVICRSLRLNAWRMADSVAIAAFPAVAVMRLGCFLNGCCFGQTTSLPWGVRFPVDSHAYFHQLSLRVDVLFTGTKPVHPTQLYEVAAALIATAVVVAILRRRAPDGVAVLAATTLFVAFRWFNLHLRVLPSDSTFNAWLMPACYAAIVAAGSFALLWRIAVVRSANNTLGSRSAPLH